MSYPSSVSGPLTPLISANAAALLLVGPVLTSTSPSFSWSLESLVGQPGSLYVPVGFIAGYVAIVAPFGHPVAPDHSACTSVV